MTLDEITATAKALHLKPLGGFHDGTTTTILIGPLDPGFWEYVTEQPAFTGSDPLDSWSEVALAQLGDRLNAQPFLPYDGPPYHPFITWALRSGEAWQSPLGMLVHKDAGLLVSYRGALRFDDVIELPKAAVSPCVSCSDRPCLTACPVGALTQAGYDVPRCKAHMDVDDTCRAACRVRMACPVSQSYPRDPAQTAFHMEAFHPS